MIPRIISKKIWWCIPNGSWWKQCTIFRGNPLTNLPSQTFLSNLISQKKNGYPFPLSKNSTKKTLLAPLPTQHRAFFVCIQTCILCPLDVFQQVISHHHLRKHQHLTRKKNVSCPEKALKNWVNPLIRKFHHQLKHADYIPSSERTYPGSLRYFWVDDGPFFLDGICQFPGQFTIFISGGFFHFQENGWWSLWIIWCFIDKSTEIHGSRLEFIGKMPLKVMRAIISTNLIWSFFTTFPPF